MEVAASRLGDGFNEAALRTLISTELKEVARAQELRAFEIPRDFIIEYEPFTLENGLLTSTLKRRRPALKARYGERLEALYDELERKQKVELEALRDSSDLTVLQKVAKALEATLSIEDVDPSSLYTFGQFGGDSLAATSFSILLEETFGVHVPVSAILSPTGNLRAWAAAVEAASHEDRGPTVASIHGKDTQVLHARDLDIGAFIDLDELDAPRELPEGEPRCVLLTGATGFLGRFLCLEWMERVASRGGKVICLVRGADQATARERLREAFLGIDPVLEQNFSGLAEKHLEVIVSDLAAPKLGLEPATFARLAREVDHIVHCGALVNHILPYADLFGPNVVSTAELARLALTTRQKSYDFISTIGMFGLLAPNDGITEDTPLAESAVVSNTYAFGYAASKWASEKMLRSVNARFGVPINIFRCDMILSNQKYLGQINVPDVFSRLLYSLVMTETAPMSFYELNGDGSRRSAHYDGLPSNFIAAALVEIGDGPHSGVRVFNVLNHHLDDGISLDRFADWIEEAGYPLERVQDYATWVEQFEQKLRALPEEKRQRSYLPVLHQMKSPAKVPVRHADSSHFAAAATASRAGEVPKLDRGFLFKCLADLEALGLIPPPESRSAESWSQTMQAAEQAAAE
jgi:fatty acid CoA ligase FadD9